MKYKFVKHTGLMYIHYLPQVHQGRFDLKIYNTLNIISSQQTNKLYQNQHMESVSPVLLNILF